MSAPRRPQPRDKAGRYDVLPARIPTAAPPIPTRAPAPAPAAVPDLSAPDWYCPRCKTTDRSLRYPSGKTKYCMDCQRFITLTNNAKKPRSNGETPGVEFDAAQFSAWIKAQDRRCAICRLPESKVGTLQLKSSVGANVVALGIDRMDSARGYALDNIQLCCFACNKAKGNVFSTDESASWLGDGIADAWTARLGEGPTAAPADAVRYEYATVAFAPGTCGRCGYTGPGADKGCKPCRKFDALSGNAERVRRDGNAPGVTFTRQEFASWLAQQDFTCRYCRVPEGGVPSLGLKTQVGHDLRYLGIDRLDNSRGYELDNIALCCFACNKVKGNVFSDTDMANHVGPRIAKIWTFRVLGRRL